VFSVPRWIFPKLCKNSTTLSNLTTEQGEAHACYEIHQVQFVYFLGAQASASWDKVVSDHPLRLPVRNKYYA